MRCSACPPYSSVSSCPYSWSIENVYCTVNPWSHLQASSFSLPPPCLYFSLWLSPSLPLTPPLKYTLQEDTDGDETWSIAMAGATCLEAMARTIEDAIVPLILPFVTQVLLPPRPSHSIYVQWSPPCHLVRDCRGGYSFPLRHRVTVLRSSYYLYLPHHEAIWHFF